MPYCLELPLKKNDQYFFRIIDGNLQGKRSQNGLWVNGQRCYSHDLRNNDVITFSGAVEATYHNLGQEEDPSRQLYPGSHGRTIVDGEDQGHLTEAMLVRLSSFPEMTPQAILEMELDGTITYLNPAAKDCFPDICEQIHHPVRVDLQSEQISRTQTYYGIREIAVQTRIYEQSIHWIPQSNLIRCYFNDITQKRKMEESVRKSEERYALAARGANDGLWDWDLETQSIYLSPRWKAMIGYEEHELTNQITEWMDRIHPEDQVMARQAINEHLSSDKPFLEFQHRLKHKDNYYLRFRCRGIAIFDHEGLPLRMAGSITDITESFHAQEKLLLDACHDSMTSLPNRLLLLDRISQALKTYKRNPSQLFALLFIDLDRFKVINDSLGHLVGDQLLIAVAHRLKNCVREEDTVARLGGDEFVILLKELQDISSAITPAIRICHSIKQSYQLEGHHVFTSASIGIVLVDKQHKKPEELLRDADMAMYQAKRNGKDNYAIFDGAMHGQALARLQLENKLRTAIERKDFELYYQPIINLETGKISAFEALIRWRDPEQGIVSPAKFIPLAEETGLIVPLGKWIIQTAFQQLKEWHQKFPSETPISLCINIASQQFSHPEFIDVLKETLEASSIPPSCIELEITEGTIMHREDIVIQKLHELKKYWFPAQY